MDEGMTVHEIAAWVGSVLSGGLLIALIKFWFDVGRSSRQIDDNEKRINTVEQRQDQFSTSLSTHQLQVERDFVKATELAAVENRFTAAVEGMRSEVRGMSQRLDRLLDGISAKGH